MMDTAIVTSMIAAAQSAMGPISEVAYRLGLTVWMITTLLTISTVIAGGASGIAAVVIGQIVRGGLILGAIAFAPIIALESFNTADAVATMITGQGVTAPDTVQRGADLARDVFDAGISGSAYNPANWIFYIQMLVIAGIIFVLHIALSLIVAISVLQLWLGAAVLTLVLPFAFINGLAAVGLMALAFLAAATLRLIFLSTIVAFAGDAMLTQLVPGPGATMTWSAGIEAVGATIIVTALSATASTMSSVLTRGAVGNTGVTGMLTSAGLMAAGARVGAARAGSAPAGQAAGGGGTGGGQAAGGGQPGGGGGRDGGVGVQDRVV